MGRTRIKICGVTRPEDARLAAAHGVDALGIICVATSPRFVAEGAHRRRIVQALPAWVSPVLVFQDPESREVEAALKDIPHALCQFHGDEDPGFCGSFGRPYIKRVPAPLQGDPEALENWHPRALLQFDWAQGGSGKALDWEALRPPRRPWVLAGGLDPENAAQAMEAAGPWGLDLCTGVEVSPGIKDADLMAGFVAAVADRDRAGSRRS